MSFYFLFYTFFGPLLVAQGNDKWLLRSATVTILSCQPDAMPTSWKFKGTRQRAKTCVFFVMLVFSGWWLLLSQKIHVRLPFAEQPRKLDSRLRIVHGFKLPTAADFTDLGCSSSVTLVTAYFDIGLKSKHSSQNFLIWNTRFFLLPDNIVVFTDVQTARNIVSLRSSSAGCTIIMVQNILETPLGEAVDWDFQHAHDPEKSHHSIELYIIWNQKSLWVSEVANANPFHSSHFFWADSGQFRDDAFLAEFVSSGEKWVTSHDFIPSCKIIFLAVEKFQDEELRLDARGQISPLDPSLVRLGGGNFGGDSCAVRKWRDLFLEQLNWYIQNGAFVGKDQPIYGSVCLTHRHICYIVDGSRVKETNDIWFGLQPILHGVTSPIPEYHLPSNRKEEPRVMKCC